jgi:glycyl-tRNA synthetase
MEKLSIEQISSFCKRKGFIFQSSEIYGGFSGFWDFGPLGVELFNNLKNHWWKHFINDKENMEGIDASIISHPRVWKASGHIDSFGDLMISCSKCKKKFRADHLIDDLLNINVEGMKIEEINKIIEENKIKCPECKNDFNELFDFNLLFKTSVGADESKQSEAYLRGETAQGMFINFKLVAETARQKLPFGIGQIGKCFRNEISPRDFIFRCREFTIAEFEFFIHPEDKKCELLEDEHLNVSFKLLDAQTQLEEKKDTKDYTIRKLVEEGKLDLWHAYWLAEQYFWLKKVGFNMDNFVVREHTKNELSHYSSGTYDFDYKYPFGTKELMGNANRGQYDLTQHINESKQKLDLYDEATKQKVVPKVIEPTFGMDRIFLATVVDAYNEDKERGNIVLKLHPKLSPYKCAVFPLMNKDELLAKSREVFNDLKTEFPTFFDKSGSIGRRYARQDEIGTFLCVTVDHQTLEDGTVTIRNRDTTEQKRVKITELKSKVFDLISKY